MVWAQCCRGSMAEQLSGWQWDGMVEAIHMAPDQEAERTRLEPVGGLYLQGSVLLF